MKYQPLTYSELSLGKLTILFIDIDASPSTIWIYLIDEENRALWQGGEHFTHHGPGGISKFEGLLTLPTNGPWWFVLENRSDATVDFKLKIHA